MAIGHAKNRTTEYGTWHFLCGRLVGTSWLVEPLVFICRRHSSGSLIPPTFYLEESGGGLRSIPGLKLVVVAAVWAYVTAVIPCVHAGTFTIGVFFERFWWTAALTLPFDVRDMIVDQGSIRTLPHMIGPRNTVWLANLMLWFSFYIQVQLFQITLAYTFGLYLLCSIIIVLANPKLGDLYYSLLIEGLPFLLLGLWVLSAYL